MEFKDRVKELRTRKGMSLEELGDSVGLQKAAIHKYETGVVVNPKRTLIEKLAKVFEVSPSYLMGWDDQIVEIPTGENATRIPVYSSVHAGFPEEAEDNIIDWEEIPRDWTIGGQEYIGIKVQGDCMEPDYREGDTIIVRRQEDCESGQVAVVYVNGYESQLRKFVRKENQIILQPTNSKYLPEVHYINDPDNPVVVVGVVVEIRRRV